MEKDATHTLLLFIRIITWGGGFVENQFFETTRKGNTVLTPMFFFGYSFFALLFVIFAIGHWQQEHPVTVLDRTQFFGGYAAALILLVPATLIGLH